MFQALESAPWAISADRSRDHVSRKVTSAIRTAVDSLHAEQRVADPVGGRKGISNALTLADALCAADQTADAVAVLRRALRDESPRDPGDLAEIRIRLADCLGARSDHETACRVLRPLLFDAPGAVWEARANLRLGRARTFFGDLESGETLCRDALKALAPTLHHTDVSMALQGMGHALHELGRMDEARAALHDALASARRARSRVREASCLGSLGRLDISRAAYDSALRRLRRSRELATALGHRPILARAQRSLSLAWLHLGEWDLAEPATAEALRHFTEIGDARGEALAWIARSRLLRHRGRDGAEAVGRAIRLLAPSRFRRGRLLARLERGDVFRAANEPERAGIDHLAVFEEARAEAPEGDLAYSAGWRVALSCLERGRVADAETMVRAALAGASRAGDLCEGGLARVALARILATAGDVRGARRESGHAVRLFSELGTPHELARAREVADRLALGVPRPGPTVADSDDVEGASPAPSTGHR